MKSFRTDGQTDGRTTGDYKSSLELRLGELIRELFAPKQVHIRGYGVVHTEGAEFEARKRENLK